ncbi:MAG: hypothetical protein QF511_01470 [Rhodospirillales bacterium]|nr:hypothetical protein [Rhodospirillales bacterium]HIJ42812.1 hypothetical protein [Rhodospirillaceae bacterium]MDP7097186.1 hypothetical protein [Rhodospirillales bacterium]MDP7215650.1 hypothetical protein [Rhodospirillales bacterium]HIJ44830.1 hypothetical protein [Rhodospirillaceae bacterium]
MPGKPYNGLLGFALQPGGGGRVSEAVTRRRAGHPRGIDRNGPRAGP